MNRPIVLAVTGASGAAYAQRLLEVLLHLGRDVALTVSPSGAAVVRQELGLSVSLDRFDPAEWQLVAAPDADEAGFAVAGRGANRPLPGRAGNPRGRCQAYRHDDFFAPIASGSFLTGGMVICPCSGTTLSAVVHASGSNLPQRAAAVQLKERRPLVLVPRETPLSVLQIDNLKRAAEAGAIVLPASPGWYHGVASLLDLVDFIVARILDQLQIEHQLLRRWGEGPCAALPPDGERSSPATSTGRSSR